MGQIAPESDEDTVSPGGNNFPPSASSGVAVVSGRASSRGPMSVASGFFFGAMPVSATTQADLT